MVLFFSSTAVDPPAIIYMGKDKYENEDLLRYGLPEDVWFHVDKVSSAHVYLRLPPSIESWEHIPEALLTDCAQLVKANSVEGNKKKNTIIIYTPHSNVKTSGDLDVGTVVFHNDRKVKRFHVPDRENAIVNRLNKTRVDKEVDHEAERQERLREEGRKKKAHATKQQNEALEAKRQYKAQAEARDYSHLFSEEAIAEESRKQQRRARLRAARTGEQEPEGAEVAQDEQGAESDDSFM